MKEIFFRQSENPSHAVSTSPPLGVHLEIQASVDGDIAVTWQINPKVPDVREIWVHVLVKYQGVIAFIGCGGEFHV
ncbi:hypothetical protein RRG08_063061 [Elysia crispata]|uniref:Uncharacterized protein n=1 Tax=Elysia crispata TaxID=231223 RepID=A0AAE0YDR7_9GAST|nr:hypothetical protein RRG08_063061 [Elysia crispata]